MLTHGRRDRSRYGMAFLSVGLILAIHQFVVAVFPEIMSSPFLLVFIAVMISAWYGGRGPGLLATTLLVPVIDYFWLDPPRQLFANSLDDNIKLSLFITEGILISVLGGARHTAEARQSSVLASATDAIITINHLGHIVDFNPAAEKIFGRTKREVIRKRIFDLIIPERFRAAHWEALRSYIATGRSPVVGNRVELAALRRDGREFPVEMEITPLVSDELPMFTAFIRDLDPQRQAEEDLRESNERFRILAESVPSVIWTAAPDGHVRYVNQQWFDYTGLLAEQNFQWPELVLHPDDRERCLTAWAESLASGRDYEIEARNRRYDGVYRWFLTRAVPLRDSKGKITAWFGTTTDIEQRKRTEAAQHFLAQASAELTDIQSIDDTLIEIVELAVTSFADWACVDVRENDDELRRLAPRDSEESASPTRERNGPFRYSSGDYFGINQVAQTGNPEIVQRISADWLDAVTDQSAQQRIRESGLTSYMCVPLKTSQRVLGVLTFVMAESQRCYDDEDLRVAKELAQRISAAIDHASLMRALQEADRRKDEFLANVSHELRTPMNAILGMLQLALGEELNPELRDYLETAKESADNLLFLLDDILDFSRIKVGGFRIERMQFSLRETIATATNILKKRASDKDLDFSSQVPDDLPDRLVGDSRRLRQVIINLVNNAIKFTERGAITVSVNADSNDGSVDAVMVQVSEVCQEENECPNDQQYRSQPSEVDTTAATEATLVLKFTVVDTGMGIASEHQDRIFAAFTQLDASATRPQSGIGLGLAICRELLNRMGGRIWLESELGQGSCFHFTVPFQIAAAESEADMSALSNNNTRIASSDDPPLAQLHILLCEDNPANQKVVQGILAKRGHRVEIANDGRAAIARSTSERFDVILMDVQMPIVDGVQATVAIRQQKLSWRIPIIGISAHAMRDDHQRFLAAGMDTCLTKPLDANTLINTVERLAGRTAPVNERATEALRPEGVVDPTNAAAKVFDPDSSLKRLGGNTQLFRDLIQLFYEDSPGLLDEIRTGLRNGDVAQVNRAAHALKGLAAIFSADAAEIAGRIEQEKESAALEPIVELLEQQIDRLSEELATFDDHGSSPDHRGIT